MMLLGSGVLPPQQPLVLMVKASEGMVPTELSEACDGPPFSSQKTWSPLATEAFARFSQ